MSHSLFRRAQYKSHAFSLIEVVLAIGIISFALVGIIGLFPAALKASQDSQTETIAALIARRIIDNLRTTSPVIEIDGKSTENSFKKIDLRSQTTETIEFNASGLLKNSTSTVDGNAASEQTMFVAKLVISPQPDPSKLSLANLTILAGPLNKSSNTPGARYEFAAILLAP